MFLNTELYEFYVYIVIWLDYYVPNMRSLSIHSPCKGKINVLGYCGNIEGRYTFWEKIIQQANLTVSVLLKLLPK